ncbi:MAG: PH domain-containing protein [Planctomycetes bacterium]|nr:PH domain-containing protein [Planctomycetota bacterium]
MKAITIIPEKNLQTMWFIVWVIGLIIGLIIFSIATAIEFVFSFLIIIWLIIFIPFLLYIPAFYKTLEYIVDDESLKTQGGVFWKKHSSLTYAKITNIDITQGPLQRMFNIGTIHVQTAGASGTQGTLAELRLLGIKDLQELKETILTRMKNYALSRSEQSKETIKVPESDQELLKDILEELKAIRKSIEKKIKIFNNSIELT